mgnify:CR=1 FL=1
MTKTNEINISVISKMQQEEFLNELSDLCSEYKKKKLPIESMITNLEIMKQYLIDDLRFPEED